MTELLNEFFSLVFCVSETTVYLTEEKNKNNTVYNKLVVNKTKVEKNYDGRGEAKTKHFIVHGHQRGQTSRGADGIMQVHQQDYILDPRFDIL